MTDSEADVLRRLKALTKELKLSYDMRDEDFDSASPMNMDSLEFMSLVIEIQREFGVEIPDETVQEKGLKTLRNLVQHLVATSEPKPAGH